MELRTVGVMHRIRRAYTYLHTYIRTYIQTDRHTPIVWKVLCVLHLSTAQPHTKRHLNVFCPPYVHIIVEAADRQEVILSYSECAADQRRSPVRLVFMFEVESSFLVLRHLHPYISARAITRSNNANHIVHTLF